ncbi:KilA-N domain-containing protein [Burkholderia multivorans]|uniref:KilA-N domain-containing protein n=1 Tax=Burkholderia multivorans TaxID=87883 RepID=UPI001C611C64|nr:KilA-N domain-containing protein [Burkholderia multivorans]MDN8088815.1 KilA-N domain-containing protein [Burkholderia multivorans]MDN8094601.1 KilA-N domain-containing protein [Burkholderia multivorans]MDN8107684.1 KilA-N domain-containing protein [Burkholderia multivorans]MDN8125032.1 KilA-N domain-containing protein [Burkholderia multivorans]MDN8130809.1 KilA-N domain-containing protein [Burkholderia multivorans]
MNALTITGVAIRTDAEGRYCLNDLHRAAGGEKRHQPSDWLRLKNTQELIAELAVPGIPGTLENQPLAVIQGGIQQGTYVVKELVYAYAMWISPAFHLKVIRAYDEMVSGGQVAAASLPNFANPAEAARAWAEQFEQRAALEHQKKALDAKLAEQAPKVETYERIPMTTLPTVSGIVQTISVKTTNTGASTYSPDGLPSRPIYGLGGGALQGGELVANGIATLVSYVGPLLNGGSLCWVLFECIGGAQQVAPATQSRHAVQLGQLFGGLKGIGRWAGAGTYQWTVPANVTTVYASGTAPGGGGGAGGSGTVASSPAIAGGGGGGGAGQSIVRQPYTVVPGSTVTITIGTPGSGGTAVTTGNGSPGGTAGNLVISGSGFNGGTPVTLTGGSGGGGGSAVQTSSGGAATGGGAGSGYPAGSYGNDTSAGYASGSGGAGASGPFGGGGGAARTSTAGSLAGGNAYGYGAGGGGGAGVYSSNAGNGGGGGSGAPGFMTFEW